MKRKMKVDMLYEKWKKRKKSSRGVKRKISKSKEKAKKKKE